MPCPSHFTPWARDLVPTIQEAWVGPRANLDRCRESCPHQDSTPYHSACIKSLHQLCYPSPRQKPSTGIVFTHFSPILTSSWIFYILCLRLLWSAIFTPLWTVTLAVPNGQQTHSSSNATMAVAWTIPKHKTLANTMAVQQALGFHGSKHVHKGLSLFIYLYILSVLHA
jgi:hypothetical protein